MKTDYQYFDVPATNRHAAKKMGKKRLYKEHSDVPTRKEVANVDIHTLTKILTGWMCNSPTEIIPSRTQIAEVRNILLERSDVSQLTGLITMCNYYINGD